MADKQKLIEGLNEDLNLELEAVLRMIYHSATATGLLGHELRESLKEDLTGEIEHAMYLADKIVSLGGEPHINPQCERSTSRPRTCSWRTSLRSGKSSRITLTISAWPTSWAKKGS